MGIIGPCANWFIINKGCKIPVHTVHQNIHQKKTNSLVAFDKGGLKLITNKFSENIKENISHIDLFVDFMVCMAIDSNCLLRATHGQYGTEACTKDHTHPGFRGSVPQAIQR